MQRMLVFVYLYLNLHLLAAAWCLGVVCTSRRVSSPWPTLGPHSFFLVSAKMPNTTRSLKTTPGRDAPQRLRFAESDSSSSNDEDFVDHRTHKESKGERQQRISSLLSISSQKIDMSDNNNSRANRFIEHFAGTLDEFDAGSVQSSMCLLTIDDRTISLAWKDGDRDHFFGVERLEQRWEGQMHSPGSG